MDTSLHYLTMANHLLIQKRILEKVKESGLTLGTAERFWIILKVMMEQVRRKLQRAVLSRRDR